MSGPLERALVAAARRLEPPAQWLLARPPFRSWLRRRASGAWRTTGTPLILCYGNINRSAFAAALVRRQRPGAASGGFYPVENRPAPDATIACAGHYGVDLTGHRSRCVTDAELEAADAIFVFDLENLARLAARRPSALLRAHLIGSLDDDPRLLIADPHGRTVAVLEETLGRIARALDHAERAV